MFEMLAEIETSLEQAVGTLDPTALDGEGAVALLDRFSRLERLAAAGTAMAGAAIEATDAWRGTGQRDAIGFVAARTACPRGRIRDALGVADRLTSMPQVDGAVRSGAITLDQAADIAAAVAEHPHVETELVALAAQVSPRQLKERCVAILAQGDGAEQQHRRAKADRSASSQVGRDGVWRLAARMPIIDGAFVDKTLDYFQTRIFDDARHRGEREPYAAYRADALVAMARAAFDHLSGWASDGTDEASPSQARPRRRRGAPRARSSSLRHTIVVTVPHSVFTSRSAPGETCQVPGVGPVPVSVVNDLLADDPVVKAVVTKGRDITAVATLTRTVKEDLRLAVLAANGLRCAVPGCDSTRFLELDHRLEFSELGPTSYDNLRPLCCFHHDQRTRHGYQLRGSPGDHVWTAPDGAVLAAERSAVPG